LSRGRISCKFDLFFRVDFNKQNTYKMALFTKEFNMDEVPVLPYSDIKAPHKLRKLLIERDEEIEELKKQLRVAKLVTKKLNKEVKTTRDKWHDETALLVKSQIANRSEIVMLKEQIRCPGCPLQLEDDTEVTWRKLHKSLGEEKEKQIKELDSIIDYHDIKQFYLDKFIERQQLEHEWREFAEELAHKNGNKKHIRMLFDD